MKSDLVTDVICSEVNSYPVLGIHEDGDIVILFHRPKCGTVVHSFDGSYSVGEYSEDWDMDGFTVLPKGQKIYLEND